MHPEPNRDLLLRIASLGPVTQADFACLDHLLASGLLKRVEAPRSENLQARYEVLQEQHQRFLEAKSGVDRLLVPRKGLSRWFSGVAETPPSEEALTTLFALMEQLGVKIRGCEKPADLMLNLDRVRECLQVEDRDCLDRMGSLDRELNALEKLATDTLLVESFGPVSLTKEGRSLLPETSVMAELETVFNLVSGPRQQKITEYEHFRRDPATLLAFVLANPCRMERTADVVDAFEALGFRLKDMPNVQQRNALIIRLLRCFREHPKRAHFWCGRERLQELAAKANPVTPPALLKAEGHHAFAVDLLLAGSSSPDAEDPHSRFEERLRLMESVQSQLLRSLGSIPLGEIPRAHLAMGLLHEALARQVAGPVLAGRLVQRMVVAALEAMVLAPVALGDPSARLIFGFHLAHWSDFQPQKAPEIREAFLAMEAAFASEGRRKGVSPQILLHALGVLQRLKALGSPVAPEEYAGTHERILKGIQHHRDLSRAFAAEHLTGEEDSWLAANLAARAYFLQVQPGTRYLPDVGPAGAYEDPNWPSPPLLGLAFGTVFL